MAGVLAREVHPCPHCRDQYWFRRGKSPSWQHIMLVDRTGEALRRRERIDPDRVRPVAGWECGSCGRVAPPAVAADLDRIWLQFGWDGIPQEG